MKSQLSVAAVSAFIGASIVLSIQACGQAGDTAANAAGHTNHTPPPTTNGASAKSGTPSDQLHEIMMRPMSNMNMTGDVDKDFAALMIPHHQGAIDMAKIELAEGKNPELKALAKSIIDSQAREIEILKKHAPTSR